MDINYLQDVVDLCDEAILALKNSDEIYGASSPSPTTTMNNVGHALLEANYLRPDLRKLIQAKDQGPLRLAALSVCINMFRHGSAYADHSEKIFAVKRILEENIKIFSSKKIKIPHVIFYSWQSDLPNSLNRGFINECIDVAVKKIAADGEVYARVDQGPQGASGSQSLHGVILSKIENCGVFVADVSLVGGEGKGHSNSNVMYELGYATRCLGEDRVILICNTSYGQIESLPFDIKHKIVLGYKLSKEDEKPTVRRILTARVEEKIRIAFSKSGKA
jgi:hypothetical protein